MPANKNQIRRIQTILKMMRQNKFPNYSSFIKEMQGQDIAGTYKLSSKTFSRDIADLKDEYGAPIRYDASRKGFYLTDTDWCNEDLMIEPFEMKAALLSERVAENILPEPLRSEINKAVGALLMKNENGMAQGAELQNFQVISPEYLPQVDPDIFITCYNAWEQRKYLQLLYTPVGKKSALKLFEPHIFAWNAGSWYLKGKLVKDNDTVYDPPMIQILAVHRISEAKIIESQFTPAPEILKAVKNEGFFDFKKIPEVVVEFFQPFVQPMAEKYAGAIVKRSEESVTVRLQNLIEYEAIQMVLATCGNARVHEPEELKNALCAIAEKIQDHHK